MKARIAQLSACLLILGSAACNRPAGEPAPDILATSVAATLTAQPTPSETPIPPSPTPAPVATDTPPPDPSATLEPTSSPIPTNTAFPLPPDDPRSGLDLTSPDHADNFGQRGAWFEYPADFEDATILWEDGRMRTSDNKADGFLWWSASGLLFDDFYAEIDIEVTDCTALDAYGLAFRVDTTNYDQGYTLEISCDGQYRLRRFISEATPEILLNWTPGGAIVPGPNATNRIGVLAQGEQLHAFANGELLTEVPVEDSAYESGTLGLFTSAAKTPGLTAYFDNLQLWFLSP